MVKINKNYLSHHLFKAKLLAFMDIWYECDCNMIVLLNNFKGFD